MKTKQLGNSDLFITPVGFGSRAVGGAGWQFGWGKQNDHDSIAAIHRALALGVNWIDTAAVYGLVDDVVAAEAVHLTQSELTEIEPVAELAGRAQ